MRNFYAIVYPKGVDKKNPTYPVEVSIHLADLDLARHDYDEKLKIKRIFDSNWKKLYSSHKIAVVARKLAGDGAEWPITMTLAGPKEVRLEERSKA